ncbi:hypothetical protein KEM56_002783 [Ascosphaera pollenicola]|nr:hypothetical protein KEM56_002783 [Ascosphaera pollenicola]
MFSSFGSRLTSLRRAIAGEEVDDSDDENCSLSPLMAHWERFTNVTIDEAPATLRGRARLYNGRSEVIACYEGSDHSIEVAGFEPVDDLGIVSSATGVGMLLRQAIEEIVAVATKDGYLECVPQKTVMEMLKFTQEGYPVSSEHVG